MTRRLGIMVVAAWLAVLGAATGHGTNGEDHDAVVADPGCCKAMYTPTGSAG